MKRIRLRLIAYLAIFAVCFAGFIFGADAINQLGDFSGEIEFDFDSTAYAVDWDVIDNNAAAVSWDSAGKEGIIRVVSTDSGEGVTMSGTLGVTGTMTALSYAIGANTLTTSEWAYLDGQDQAVAVASSPTFVGLDLTEGNLTNVGDVQCDSITADSGALAIASVSGGDITVTPDTFGNTVVHLTDDVQYFIVGGGELGGADGMTSAGTATLSKLSHGIAGLSAGNFCQITDATTAADEGGYQLESSTADVIVLDRALAGSDADVDIKCYDDVIVCQDSDGTEGMWCRSYSNDAAMQWGGATRLTAAYATNGEDNIFGGLSEFRGTTTYFRSANFYDGAITIANLYMAVASTKAVSFGGSYAGAVMIGNTGSDQFNLNLDATIGRQFVISGAGINYNYDHPIPADPETFGHSVTHPTADNREYWGLTHNKVASEFRTGKGYHYFTAAVLAANGTMTLTANLTAADAFTVGEENGGAGTQFIADTDFSIGASATATCLAIANAVNGSAEGGNLTAIRHGDIVVFEHDTAGVAGNAAILTEDVDGGGVFSVTGAGTLTGGRDAVTGTPAESPTSYFSGITEFATTVHQIEESADIEQYMTVYDDDASEHAIFNFRKADNTIAAPALVDDGDKLGEINFWGHDGSGWELGTIIRGVIDGTPSDGTDMPTALEFYTSAEASSTPTLRMTIDSAGDVTVPGHIHGAAHDYGEMYIDSSTDIGTVVKDTWYEVDGYQSGELESITHSNGDMTIAETGIYEVHYSCSATGGAVKTYEYSISIDNAIQSKCTTSRKYAANDLGSNSGHCILDLTATEVLKLEMRNVTDGTDIAMHFSNVHAHIMH